MTRELVGAIPRVAKMLKTTVDNVKVVDSWAFPSNHMYSNYADHPVEVWGLADDLPFLQNGPLHSKRSGGAGYGLILYECREARHLKYVLYNSKNSDGWKSSTYICEKGELAKVVRNCKKMQKRASTNAPPILREGLMDDVVRNSIYFILNSKRIEKYGVRIKRGLLLDGPPGNGKTMACRYIQKLCTQNNIDFGVISAADIDKAYADNAVEALFNRFQVSFFDDIDISYLSRRAGNGKMACSILSAMDGMCDAQHTIRFFTTNEEIKDLDPRSCAPEELIVDLHLISQMQNSDSS